MERAINETGIRMKVISKVTICFAFMFLFVSFTHAQKTKTVKGYFCGGQPEGNAFASTKIRVGKTIFDFTHSLGYVKYVGFKKKGATKIGAEYIVKYRNDGDGDWAESITFTGRSKKTEPCN